MLAAISAATLNGAVGRPVSVEVHVSNGLPGFTIVGLPDAAVRESRDRVRAALLSSGVPWPLRRVTVNLAPSRYQSGKYRSQRSLVLTRTMPVGFAGSDQAPLSRHLSSVRKTQRAS